MTFYADPSFFALLALAVAGAAFLGLREKPLARYGMAASVVFLACLFCKDLPGLIAAAGFVVVAVLSMRWVLAAPRSNLRFAVAFALTLLPLVSAKAGAVFDQNLLGFMGVSYLTFKALQVMFEVRDGVIKECGLFDYLYFLLFFPVFTSGPIDRSRRFAEDARAVRSRDEYAGLLARGILLVLVGLVYTFVVAAWLHRFYVPATWGSGPFLTELAAQVQTAYVYGLYLFFDFAGYSLMAMGASYCFGIRTPRNFRAPFASLDIKDFWNRWNITLSFWLRDFVFMRFSRLALKKRWFASRLTTACWGFVFDMALMGAWHGLTADYLLYGLFHGLLLAGTEVFQKKSKFYKKHKNNPAFKALSWFVTLQLVMFGFALFSGQITMLVKGAFHWLETDHAELEEKMLDILEEVCGDDEVRARRDEDLFALGLLDSMGAIELLVDIEDVFGVCIAPTEVERDEMNAVDTVVLHQVEIRGSGRDRRLPSNNRGAAPTGMALLRGVLVGLLAAALVLTGACFALPPQDAHDPARLYDYVYSGVSVAEHGVHAVCHERRRACGVRVVGVLHLEGQGGAVPAGGVRRAGVRRGPRVRGRGLRSEPVAGHRGRRVRQRGAEQEGDAGRVSAVVLQEQRGPGQVRLEVLVDAVPAVRGQPERLGRRRRRTCARASSSWAWTRRRRPPRTATPCSTRSTTWRVRSPTT